MESDFAGIERELRTKGERYAMYLLLTHQIWDLPPLLSIGPGKIFKPKYLPINHIKIANKGWKGEKVEFAKKGKGAEQIETAEDYF